jgi:glycosyltransferase involved in cell wall biosynthesis
MKIIYLHQYFNTPAMPGGTRSYEFSKKLIKMGHKIEMITTYREQCKSEKWFKTKNNGINIHWLPLNYSNNMNFFNRLRVFFIFAWKAYFKAKKIDADIIYASSTPLTIAIPAVFVKIKKNIPMVFEVRDLWPDVPIAMKILKNPFLIYAAKLLELWAYKNSNSIVALSPQMKKGIVAKKIDSKKIAIIPNSSDLEKFCLDKNSALNFRNRRKWLKNRPLLLYAGTFGKVNDLSYAVKLAKSLMMQNSEIRILLIGDGAEKKKLVEEAKRNGVYKKNLFIEKQLPKKDMPACLSAASMIANFVVNIRENWANSANKFFDGLAAGKPIFLNHGGWMQNLVSINKCGLCMHGKKMEIVAKELNIALSDKKWLKFSGNASKNLAKNFFDRNIHAKQIEEVLYLTQNNKSKLVSKVTSNFYK